MSANLRNLLHPRTKVQTSPLAPGSSKRALLCDSEDALTFATTPAFVHLTFPSPVQGATHLALTFQGGFVGTSAMVYVGTQPKEGEGAVVLGLGLVMAGRIHPEDISRRQVFRIPYPPNVLGSRETTATSEASLISAGNETERELRELKIDFEDTSDNQGRVTVYQLELLG